MTCRRFASHWRTSPSLSAVWSLAIVAAMLPAARAAEPAAPRVDYNKDIRPLLSDTCYKCHGPDEKERQAGLRLDVRDSAVAELESGAVGIVPGKSEGSEVLHRITSADPERLMPPVGSGKSLSPQQIALIKAWIDQGAEYRGHWAFERPARPAPPTVKHEAAVRNPIDRFVLARLEAAGLEPSPEADKLTLIRRVTLDLTGLPPTLAEIDAFLADTSPQAYETLVDRLLASPRYGEQMARYWLDAARYGDTHGLHLDNERSLWPYRDWVIGAFNRNQPFDQFTIEQLAGDLLPGATTEQRVATGFNRCNVTTSEGGSINEEYLVRYAVDRVETTATVWLGLTAGCAVCHDHKFDPISQKEFYQLFAYFNSLTEQAMDGNAFLPPPAVRVPSDAHRQRVESLQQQIAGLQAEIESAVTGSDYVDPGYQPPAAPPEPKDFVWFEDEPPAGAKLEVSGGHDWEFVSAPEHPVFSGAKASRRTAKGLSQHLFTGPTQPLIVGEGDKLFAHVYLDPQNLPQEIMLQFQVAGSWEQRAFWGEDVIPWGKADSAGRVAMGPLPEAGKWVRLEVEIAKVGINKGTRITGWAFTQHDGHVYWDQAGLVTRTPQTTPEFASQAEWVAFAATQPFTDYPVPVAQFVRIDPPKRTDDQNRQLREYFLEHVYVTSRPVFDPLHEKLKPLTAELAELDKLVPSTMVMEEMAQPREAFILVRGAYDKPGDKVARGVPAVFPPLPDGAPANRLGLAQWLVRPDHPLTARVTVNRFWQQYFGAGIVRTAEDFGSQGEWPSHPELLDWLATEFIGTGWDVKRMQKLIVMSGAYRQSARVTPQLFEKDRENRLLARGPRFRMDAEMVRDLALFTSGLMVEKIGGPSVKPYQPSGLWETVGYPTSTTSKFKQDHGDALYRRSLYTFWKRTSPPPSLTIFDAPSRESCTVARARTNTPMQALTLMNDIQYVEAARKLAERTVLQGGADTPQRAAYAFRVTTGRAPNAQELSVLQSVYDKHLAKYREQKAAAEKLLSIGEAPHDKTLDSAELAAWTMVANMLLNLDETITK